MKVSVCITLDIHSTGYNRRTGRHTRYDKALSWMDGLSDWKPKPDSWAWAVAVIYGWAGARDCTLPHFSSLLIQNHNIYGQVSERKTTRFEEYEEAYIKHKIRKKQGRIHGNTVADGLAGAVSKNHSQFRNVTYRRTDGPTDTASCRVACLHI